MIVVAFVFCVLAAIGWAAAWQTMHWLGQAEDLLERARSFTDFLVMRLVDRDGNPTSGGIALYVTKEGTDLMEELQFYERRTPRRPS